MNISIAIVDGDRNYAERLSEVLQQYRDLSLSIFTSADKLQSVLEKKRFDIILFDPDISAERLMISGARLALCLYSDGCVNGSLYPECARILKYQRASGIYRDVLREYANVAGNVPGFGSGTGTEVIGVYSPVGGAGKTTIALAVAGKLKSLGHSVLFMNTEQLESTSAVNVHEEDGIAMLVEDTVNENVNFKVKLTAISKHGLDDLEYLEGFTRLVDYDAVTGEEITRVFESIKRESDYRYVVVDMDANLDPRNRAVFELADRIILVEKPGELPVRKMELFFGQVFAQERQGKFLRLFNFAENNSSYSDMPDVPVLGKVHNYGNLKLESMIHAMNTNGEYAVDLLTD